MKYIRAFENMSDEAPGIMRNCLNYIIETSELIYFEEGYVGYSTQQYNNKDYYTYYIRFDKDLFMNYRIGIDKIETFLNDYKIPRKNKKKKHIIEIEFDINKEYSKLLSDLYKNTKKFNL